VETGLEGVCAHGHPVEAGKRWQKDGSLVVEIGNMVDGNEGSVTATRTVVLGFDRSDKAKVLKSTIKFAFEKP
jgi:hypothetical protein